MFKEVLENIARIDRVFTQPSGSLVLAGRSGVGRRTAVMLVAHMHQVTVVTPKVSRGYGVKQFKNDLKTVSKLSAKYISYVRQFNSNLTALLPKHSVHYVVQHFSSRKKQHTECVFLWELCYWNITMQEFVKSLFMFSPHYQADNL